MGTRNLTIVILNNEVKVAQYGQWDGYLRGQGKRVFDFISKKMDLRKFKAALKKCQFISEKEHEALWKNFGVDNLKEGVSGTAYTEFVKKYPSLSRDTCAQILNLIQKKNGVILINELNFAADSLFCEWAYVLDLDNKALEIYRGFNKTPLKKGERFKNLTKFAEGGYHPIKLWKTIPFKKVNMKTLKALQKEYNQEG